MRVAAQAPAVLASSAVEVAIAVDAAVATVVEAVVEGRRILLGRLAWVLAVGDLVDSSECWRKQMGRRRLAGVLAAVTCVALLDIHCPMIFRFVVGSPCCCGHILAGWPCSLLPQPQPPKIECVDQREALNLLK